MRFLHRKCSYFKKIKQTSIHSYWCEYLSAMGIFLLRSGQKLQNMLYGIEALHNYGNECNTDRGVDKGKLFWGGGANPNLPTKKTSLNCGVKEL